MPKPDIYILFGRTRFCCGQKCTSSEPWRTLCGVAAADDTRCFLCAPCGVSSSFLFSMQHLRGSFHQTSLHTRTHKTTHTREDMADDAALTKRHRPEGVIKTCYRCGEVGHISMDCPNVPPGMMGERSCYNCGGTGHISRYCPSRPPGMMGDRSCYNCGQRGHISRECPTRPAGGMGDRSCYNCGQRGHISRECPNGGGDGFRSGQRGRTCYHCQQEGHIARDCPNAPPGGAPRGDATCYNCGQPGHMSRSCPVR